MRSMSLGHRALSAVVLASLALGAPFAAASPAPRRTAARVGQLPPGSQRPTREVMLSIGEGELITLPSAVTDVWTSNATVADVYVGNPRQIHLFGKEAGEATIFATTAGGEVLYSASVRVNQNLSSLDRMLRAAIPEADVRTTTVGQITVLNGTVASPSESAQVERLALAALNPGINTSDPAAALKMAVINRLKLATPLQVNLQVRIAEVSRSYAKNIGVNIASRDTTGGFRFGIGQGSVGAAAPGGSLGVGSPAGPLTAIDTGTTLGVAGRLLGLDLLGAIDLGERTGQVTTLANPNLTALSGETASFLAGGEIPILISQGLGAVSVEYKPYGVSLAYTPTVLTDGRISLRVRPEVSQLTDVGAVQLSNNTVPALITRRTETTVELGSGESLMISGLLSNSHNNSIDRAPGLGNLPIIGALFRSNGFTRNETELVVIITPYLVKPVNSLSRIALPTDGYRTPSDVERVFAGTIAPDPTGEPRPVPTLAPPVTGPQSASPALPAGPSFPPQAKRTSRGARAAAAAPGFSNQ